MFIAKLLPHLLANKKRARHALRIIEPSLATRGYLNIISALFEAVLDIFNVQHDAVPMRMQCGKSKPLK